MNTIFVAAAILFLSAATAVATELREFRIEVSFRLPDGTTRSIVLTDEEARSEAGNADAYGVEWWIRAARAKLSIPAVLSCAAGGPELKSVVAVSNQSDAPDDTWSLLQPRHDLPQVSVAYERNSCQ